MPIFRRRRNPHCWNTREGQIGAVRANFGELPAAGGVGVTRRAIRRKLFEATDSFVDAPLQAAGIATSAETVFTSMAQPNVTADRATEAAQTMGTPAEIAENTRQMANQHQLNRNAQVEGAQ